MIINKIECTLHTHTQTHTHSYQTRIIYYEFIYNIIINKIHWRSHMQQKEERLVFLFTTNIDFFFLHLVGIVVVVVHFHLSCSRSFVCVCCVCPQCCKLAIVHVFWIVRSSECCRRCCRRRRTGRASHSNIIYVKLHTKCTNCTCLPHTQIICFSLSFADCCFCQQIWTMFIVCPIPYSAEP